MKSTFLNFLFIGFLFASCNGQTNAKYESIEAVTFAEKIKSTPQATIIDVRSPEEFAGQHINNAVNIDWNGDNFEGKLGKYDKSKPIFVYCMSGGRSKQAAEKLGKRFKVFPFDEIFGNEASRILVNQKLKEASLKKNADWLYNPSYAGKILLRDGIKLYI
jgi:rhodanese-related sulfurtransferase